MSPARVWSQYVGFLLVTCALGCGKSSDEQRCRKSIEHLVELKYEAASASEEAKRATAELREQHMRALVPQCVEALASDEREQMGRMLDCIAKAQDVGSAEKCQSQPIAN